MSEWISVKDKLPPVGVRNCCIFFNGKKEVTYGYAYPFDAELDTGISTCIWINDMDRETNEIATHWMPLPEAPKDE